MINKSPAKPTTKPDSRGTSATPKAQTVKEPVMKADTVKDEKQSMMTAKDLSKEAPQSPRQRVAGYAIAKRSVDKCLASVAGTAGEYHFDCPLDNLLFTFKGITGEQFKKAVQTSKSYADVGHWLETNGATKTPAEVKTWSDQMDASSPMKNPEKKAWFIETCSRLGLNAETNSMFDMLEADDRDTFRAKKQSATLAI